MQLAIKKAREGVKKGELPFGACISDVKMDGFTVLETPHELFTIIGNGKISARRDILKDQNIKLFREWERRRYLR